jgi:tRNA pseudouridine32 synthase/23S rRNA pseudouridine746 synthase
MTYRVWDVVVDFEPTVAPPARFPSPFGAVHPIAAAAALHAMAALDPSPREGKMFGVLVVRTSAGELGYLRAFSGMLDGTWHVPGFAPPLFDVAARDAFWIDGEADLRERASELAELARDAVPVRDELAALDARHARELATMRERHRNNRAVRRAARQTAQSPALDQASRDDAAERRRLDAATTAARTPIAAQLAALDAARAERECMRAERSRELLHRIHATYAVRNARGERRELRALFATAEPPGGAGDCAAPKLLAAAYALGLAPIALAEFWWGPPAVTGDRRHAMFYSACRRKCGPLLPFMLEGLDAEPAPSFGGDRIAAEEPRVVYEDAWLAIVDKPCGLLSVPGRGAGLRDSVLVRMRARDPSATVVHRLDLDTSGLMIVAKDAATHAALQRRFAERAIDKRYAAWLDGEVARDGGVVELALRVDLDDRPRQIHDPVHGRAAVTEWRVVERGPRTLVALSPRTGRTHQLRVHAAHPLGIGVPIAGDRLYGRAGGRLMLHAQAIGFIHPHTGRSVEIDQPPRW